MQEKKKGNASKDGWLLLAMFSYLADMQAIPKKTTFTACFCPA